MVIINKNPLPGYLSSKSKDKGDEFESKLDNVEINIDNYSQNKKLALTANFLFLLSLSMFISTLSSSIAK